MSVASAGVRCLGNVRRDASLRRIVAGNYMLTRAGEKPVLVSVFEDPESCELMLRAKGVEAVQRVDEIDEAAVFHRVGGDAADVGNVAVQVGMLLAEAVDLRQNLRLVEDGVNQLLGSQTADGSELSDAVCAAVRDGVGSAIELADLAGRLRR
jgi:hypothetical protein